MKLIFQGKNVRVSAALRSHAEKHVVARLRRFFDSPAAELRVEVEKANRNRGESMECHLTLRMPGAPTIEIEESLPDLYGAIDLASDRLVRAAKKQLERRRWTKGGQHRHQAKPI